MKIGHIEVEQTLEQILEQVGQQIEQERNLSATLRTALELLLTLVTLLLNRLGLNSRNSSKPPSSDPNRMRKNRRNTTNKPGAQAGHTGNHLELVDDPDQIELLEVDRATLPTDGTFQRIGVERRQVFDIQISSVVTEYQAEILEDEHGRRVVAPFPEHVTVKAQYASGVKIHSVYMSNFQLLPYKRIEEHFADQFSIPLSTGSIDNFNKEAYEKLAPFEDWVKQQLAKAPLLHADETGIDIGGHRKWLHVACSTRTDRMNQNIYRGHRKWLHVACSPTLTLLMPHEKRGGEAIAAMGVLPEYTSFPSTLAPEYMIIGNPTTSCAVATPCATLTTCASCSGLGSRTNSSGLNTCKRCCWRSTRSLKPQAVCSTPRKPTPSERAIDNSSKRPRSRVPQRTSHNGKKASAVD